LQKFCFVFLPQPYIIQSKKKRTPQKGQGREGRALGDRVINGRSMTSNQQV